MCGISFYYTRDKTREEELHKSLKLIQHRGPDSTGAYFKKTENGFLGMGHNRLSIIDVSSSGSQPMRMNDLTLIFNGEIYNYKELRANLIKLGYIFKSDTDTEVILNCYKEFGIECFSLFKGMFAFVLLDEDIKRAFLVRDCIGIKPLYLSQSENSLFASSEIKGLKAFTKVNADISEHDIFEFFNTGFLYEPDTGFKNIKKLLPGHYLELDLVNHSTSLVKYEIPSFNKGMSLKEMTSISMNMQQNADVPLGIFFSGGIDSTILASMAERPKLLFAEYESDQNNAIESKFASQISDHLNGDLKKVHIKGVSNRPEEILESVYFVADHTEELISDYTLWPTYLLSKAAKENGYKVMLSGMGGDEVFAGYPRYLVTKYDKFFRLFSPLLGFFNFFSLIPKTLDKKLDRLISYIHEDQWSLAYSRLLGYFSREELNDLFDNFDYLNNAYKAKLKKIDKKFSSENKTKRAQYFDTLGCLSHNLSIADKASMLASIELRVPLLDEDIYTYGIESKSNLLISFFSLKNPLKHLLRSILPKRLVNRPKLGFNPPLEGLIKSLGHSLISKELEYLSKVLNKKYMDTIVNSHFERKSNNTYKIWQLLYFSRWLKINTDFNA